MTLICISSAGIGALIESWKVTKALHIKFSFRGGFSYGADTAEEVNTAQLDDTAMKYLSWLLYPLCVGKINMNIFCYALC